MKLVYIIIISLVLTQQITAQEEEKSTFFSMLSGRKAGGVFAGDYDGSTEYLSKTSPVNMDLNDSNRVKLQADIDFEDSLGNWTGIGNTSMDTTSVNALTGSYSGMIVSDTTEIMINDPFTSDITGWAQSNGIVEHYTVDNLGIGRVNALKDSATTTTTVRTTFTVPFVVGRTYKVLYDYYVPSSNTTVDGVRARFGSGDQLTNYTTTDVWTSTSEIITATTTQSGFRLYQTDGGLLVGQTAGDVVYYDDVIVYQYSGDADSNYTYLPAADFTALEDGNKYTFQMQAQSVGILGSDLMSDGGFDGTCGVEWTCEPAWSIAGGKGVANGDANHEIIMSGIVSNLLFYEATYTISDFSTGGVSIKVGNALGTTRSANGTYTEIIQAGGSGIRFRTVGSTTLKVDDVIIKLVTPPDLTLAIGDSSWTWSNIDPTASAYYVKNFEWDTTGQNLNVNSGFDTDTDWTKGTGWSIANGVASSDGSQSPSLSTLYQAETKTIGKSYRYTYTVSNWSAGAINIQYGSSEYGTARSSNGTYIETITQVTSYDFNTLVADGSFIGSVDNFIVEELPDIKLFSSQPDTIRFDEASLRESYDRTIQFWFYTIGTSGTLFELNSTVGKLDAYLSTNDIYTQYNDGQTTLTLNPSSTINDGAWHHYLLELDRDGYMKSFIDNSLVDSVDISGQGFLVFDTLYIGHDGNANFYIGYIGEFKDDRGLFTSAEKTAAYNRGIKRKHFLETGNEVGWWKFKGSDDATFLSDETGNNSFTGNNMTQADDQSKWGAYAAGKCKTNCP